MTEYQPQAGMFEPHSIITLTKVQILHPIRGTGSGTTTLQTVGEDAWTRTVVSPVLLSDVLLQAGIEYEPSRSEDQR